MGELAVIDKPALVVPEQQEISTWGDRKLDNAIQRGHSAAGAHLANYEEAATITGVLLRERKSRLAHGDFGPWLAEHFSGSRDTATRYMRMADERVPKIITDNDFELPPEATAEGEGVVEEVPEEDVEVLPDVDSQVEEALSLLALLAENWDESFVDPHRPRACRRRVDDADKVAGFISRYIAAHAAKLDQIPRAVPSEGGGFA